MFLAEKVESYQRPLGVASQFLPGTRYLVFPLGTSQFVKKPFGFLNTLLLLASFQLTDFRKL